jgi:transposase-like protein
MAPTRHNSEPSHTKTQTNQPLSAEAALAQQALKGLRAENLRLKRELEIIKKAAAYFARDVL